jgi:hypothetical protein
MGVPDECIEILLQNPNLDRSNAILFLRIARKTTCRYGHKNCYSARIKDILGGSWLEKLAAPNIEVYACIDCGSTYSR